MHAFIGWLRAYDTTEIVPSETGLKLNAVGETQGINTEAFCPVVISNIDTTGAGRMRRLFTSGLCFVFGCLSHGQPGSRRPNTEVLRGLERPGMEPGVGATIHHQVKNLIIQLLTVLDKRGEPMTPDEKIESLNLILPDPIKLPPGVDINFSWVRVRGSRVFVSGHIALNADGSVYDVVGKVGAEVSIEQGYEAARQTGLSILSSLKRELGTLNNITAWLRVFGMINTAPGFVQTPLVINGFSDLILEVFGDEVGDHSRSAVGMAELPFGAPVEIEAEVEISS